VIEKGLRTADLDDQELVIEVKAASSISTYEFFQQCQIYNHWNIQPSNTSNCIFICLVITVLQCCIIV